MDMRERLRSGLARQLGGPEGLRGRIVVRRLNRRNRPSVASAVEAAGLAPGEVAADVGFGGGVGLPMLLDAVGSGGHVHGVEMSRTMVTRAERLYREAIAAGRLTLHHGVLERLPLGDASVDGLVTTNTLYFVDDVEAVFAELARVLRPAGRAVVGIGDPDDMARVPITAHGFRLRPVDEVVAGMAATGLDVRHEQVRHGSWTFHLVVGTRTAAGGLAT
jgi:SAM-dependent methyltransferase